MELFMMRNEGMQFRYLSSTAVFRPWRRDKRSLKDDEKTVVGEEVTKNVETKVIKEENLNR